MTTDKEHNTKLEYSIGELNERLKQYADDKEYLFLDKRSRVVFGPLSGKGDFKGYL